MYYTCNVRTMIRSTEFDEFYNSLPANVQNKVKYAMNIILFTIDRENFIKAEQILLLNGFMKKSTKDYKKEIQKAEQILNSLQQ